MIADISDVKRLSLLNIKIKIKIFVKIFWPYDICIEFI